MNHSRIKSIYALLESLWSDYDWEKHKQFYLYELLAELKESYLKAETSEQKKIKKLKEDLYCSDDEWDALAEIICWARERRELFGAEPSVIASAFNKRKDALPDSIRAEFQEYFDEIVGRHIEPKLEQIKIELEKFQWEKADRLYETVQELFSSAKYQELVESYKVLENQQKELAGQRKQLAQLKIKLDDLLSKYKFSEADLLFLNNDLIGKDEYESLKSEYVHDFIQELLGIDMDEEKSLALAMTAKNMLIKARAGSGKTNLLAFKTAMLIEAEGINPDNILILAFNRKAKAEILSRIQDKYKLKSFKNARTFHGLAYQIAFATLAKKHPNLELLFDDDGDFSPKKFQEFVTELLRKIWDPVFREKMYLTFRHEFEELERYGSLLDKEDYYEHVRNYLRDVTLGGDKVKSKGEKYIADFLFEQEISYKYEKIFFWGKQVYRPDFWISYQGKEYVIEHWGVSLINPRGNGKGEIDADAYLRQRQEKIDYWKERNIPLIQTSQDDLLSGREHFEAILRDKLKEEGIVCKEFLTEDDIKRVQNRVIKSQKDRMVRLFTQFIQKAKKQSLHSRDVYNLISAYKTDDIREETFLELANKVYQEFENSTLSQGKIDYDSLLEEAIKIVHETKGTCNLRINNRFVTLNELDYIFVDECQDLSPLFYNLVYAIQAYNPKIRIVLVGDDWQAINAFAGSDLKCFLNFSSYFENAEETYLLTNYRSHKNIVDNANALMKGLGAPSRHLPEKNNGEVSIECVDDVRIERQSGEEHAEKRQQDEKFIVPNDNGFLKSRYLKRCYQIIMENLHLFENSKDGSTVVAILSRSNSIHYTPIKEFLKYLKSCFTQEELDKIGDFKEKIKIGTVHSFKGLEAKVVIVLNACNGTFPIIHPDNNLFRIFGQTAKENLDEERRLFYVALSRAEDKLYVVTERDNESDFLNDMLVYSTGKKIDSIDFGKIFART